MSVTGKMAPKARKQLLQLRWKGEIMNIWQVSAGDSRRDFSDLFLKYDIMLAGPGRFGPYRKDVYDEVINKGLRSSRKIGFLRAFSEDVKAGDIVLLRDGSEFKAIGQVANEPIKGEQ